MANDYYNHGGYPATGSAGASASARAEFDAIMAGFALLPSLAGNALELVRVNAGATGLESTATIDGIAIGGTTPAAGAFTTLTASGVATLNGNMVFGNASTDTMTIASNTITWSNAPTHSNNHTFSGNLTVSGVATLNGNMVFGNAGTDTLTIASNAVTWSSPVTHSNNHTFSGNLTVSGVTTLNGNMVFGDAIGDTLTIAPNTITWSNAPTHSNNHTFSGNLTVSGVTTLNGNMVLGNAGTDTLTIASTAVTWSSPVTHSNNHTFSGWVMTDAGTVGTPGLQVGDVNSGLYLIADNVVGMSAGGTRAGLWRSTGLSVNSSLTDSIALIVDRLSSSTIPSMVAGTVAAFLGNTAAGSPAYVSLVAGNASSSSVNFADTDQDARGYVRYSHLLDSMLLGVNNLDRVTIDDQGAVIIAAPSSAVTTLAVGQFVGVANAISTNIALSGQAAGWNLGNTSNTASSSARLQITVAGETASDPNLGFGITGIQSYTLGIDNSDTNAFVLSRSSVLGTTNTLRVSNAGEWSILAPDTNNTLSVGQINNASAIISDVSLSGNTVLWTISNASNTASSAAKLAISVAGATASDPSTVYTVAGAGSFSVGVRNNDSDAFMVSSSATLGTNNKLRIPATGQASLLEGVYTPTSSQAFTATPTFNAQDSNVFEFSGAMTANVTSCTITNPLAGQTIQIRVKQDATGGRTFASPSGAKITGAVGSTASTASILTLTYSAMDTRWEGSWLNLPV